MRFLVLAVIASVAPVLTACPAESPGPVVEEPGLGPAAEGPAPAPAAERADLEALAGSGVTGEVHVTPGRDRAHVVLMVRNAPPDASLRARVHTGSCRDPGPELTELEAVATDSTGQGRSETLVDPAPQRITDGNHIVAVHRPGADPEREVPVACAAIPPDGTDASLAPAADTAAARVPGASRP